MVPWAKNMNKQTKRLAVGDRFVDKKALLLWPHRRTARFVQADRWPTKMQVTAQYHSDVQEGILNQTTSQILKWMDHSSKTPCQVPLCQLRTNERKPWWGCHHHCTAGNVAWFRRDQGLTCIMVTAGWQFRIKRHESIGPSCTEAAQVATSGISWCTLVPTEHHSKSTKTA